MRLMMFRSSSRQTPWTARLNGPALFCLVAFLFMIISIVSVNAQCATELKPTDGFKELTAVLRCLQGEIDALKKRQSSAPAQPIAGKGGDAETIAILPNGCLNARPGDKGSLTTVVKLPDSAVRRICWADGATFLQLKNLTDDKLIVEVPGLISSWHEHNKWHKFDRLDDAVLSWRTVKLVVTDGEPPQLRLDLQVAPKAK